MEEKDTRKSITKRELVKRISDTTELRPDIVHSVLDCFADIFIQETVMNGHFNFSNCFSVKPVKRKARKQYNVFRDEYVEYPETEVLSIKLSKKINYFHRWKQRHEFNEANGMSIEDWQKQVKNDTNNDTE